jgi:signal peptidase II
MNEMFLSSIAVILLDQACKMVIVNQLSNGRVIKLSSLCRIRLVKTSFRGSRRDFAYLFLLSLIVSGIITSFRFGWLPLSFTSRVGLGAAIGGAASNVIDRLWRGGVVDFIDFGFWPVFNFADFAIVLGLLLVLSNVR